MSKPRRSTRPKPFLHASPDRKLMTKKYCAAHHIHYFETCPLCDLKQTKLTIPTVNKLVKRVFKKRR